MALTVNDLLTRARERYNAVGDEFFSDQMLRDAIFDAQSDLCKSGWVLEKTLTTTSVADQREYTYPENTLGIKEIRYNSDKLWKTSLMKDPKTSTGNPKGTPCNYGLWDEVIYLYPTPSESGDTIQIRTYAYPQDITSNADSIEVPQEYREDLINYMNYIMAQKDQNFNLADRYKNEWDRAIQKAKEQRRRRLLGDSPPMVKDTYFGGVLDKSFLNSSY